MRWTRRRVAAFGVVAVVALAGPLLGTSGATRTAVPFEINVSADDSTNSGEPTIAVDPTNPDRIIVTYTQISLSQQITDGQIPGFEDLTAETHCGVAYSRDGGHTWKRGPLPVTTVVQRACADPFVVFDAHGTAYAAAGTYDPAILVGGVRMIRSTDGGRTWSKPVEPITTRTGLKLPPDTDTYAGPSMAIDRTWLAFDDSTGTLYLSSRDFGGIRGNRFMTASHDGGRTWRKPVPVDSDKYPTGDGPISAANGTVAIAYGPPRLPIPPACTCLVLALSSDGGRTFRHRAAPFAGGNQPTIAADPTHPGRYAVLVADSATKLKLRVTNDAGRTWSKPIAMGEPPTNERSRPWLAFSRTGVLGVMWRTVRADGTRNVFVTTSYDGGRTFTAPVRVNAKLSPAAEGPSEFGDDFSHLTINGRYLYVGWGDWRSGNMDSWLGRVRLAHAAPVPPESPTTPSDEPAGDEAPADSAAAPTGGGPPVWALVLLVAGLLGAALARAGRRVT